MKSNHHQKMASLAPVFRSPEAGARVAAANRLMRFGLAAFGVGGVLLLLSIGGLVGGAVACLALTPLLFMIARGWTIYRWAIGRVESPDLLEESNRPALLAACSITCVGPSVAGMLLVPIVLGHGSIWIVVPFSGLLASLIGFVLGTNWQESTESRDDF